MNEDELWLKNHPPMYITNEPPITKREHFAAHAMQGLLACMTNDDPPSYFQNIPTEAYVLADKMIDEGQKRNP